MRTHVVYHPEIERWRLGMVTDLESGDRLYHGRDGVTVIVGLGMEPPKEAWLVDIPDHFTREVFAQLAQHVHAAAAPGDAYALRRDLDHEKGRVDRFIDHVLREPPPHAAMPGA